MTTPRARRGQIEKLNDVVVVRYDGTRGKIRIGGKKQAKRDPVRNGGAEDEQVVKGYGIESIRGQGSHMKKGAPGAQYEQVARLNVMEHE